MKGSVPLVIGADGQLGSALAARMAAAGISHWTTTRRREKVTDERLYLDLAEPASWQWPVEVSVAYLCAARTSLAACEEDPEQSREINVVRTLELIQELLAKNIFVVFFSTNRVFPGIRPQAAETEPTRPFDEYGRQKNEVEEELMQRTKNAAIVRLTKIVSSSMPLLHGWQSDIDRLRPIHPYTDMWLAPVSGPYAAEACCRIGDLAEGGIWHVSGRRDVSYADFAFRLAGEKGWDRSLVQPVASADSSHPRFTSLAAGRLRQRVGLAPPDLGQVVQEIG